MHSTSSPDQLKLFAHHDHFGWALGEEKSRFPIPVVVLVTYPQLIGRRAHVLAKASWRWPAAAAAWVSGGWWIFEFQAPNTINAPTPPRGKLCTAFPLVLKRLNSCLRNDASTAQAHAARGVFAPFLIFSKGQFQCYPCPASYLSSDTSSQHEGFNGGGVRHAGVDDQGFHRCDAWELDRYRC